MEIKIPHKRICGDITHSKQNLERNVILQEALLFAQHFKRASWRRSWAILLFLATGANWYAQRLSGLTVPDQSLNQ